MIIASPSVPHTNEFPSTSNELTGRLFTGSKEYVSSLCLFVSTNNHGDEDCILSCTDVMFPSIFGIGNLLCVLVVVVVVAIDVPSQYQAEPSSEHVNKLSGF